MSIQLSYQQKEVWKSNENIGFTSLLQAFISRFRLDLRSNNVFIRENAQQDLYLLKKCNAEGVLLFQAIELLTKLPPMQVLDALKPSYITKNTTAESA